jgi:hypothetical protein
MIGHRDPGWLSLLTAILRDSPKLSGAACAGRTLHDPPQPFEDEDDLEYRHHRAVTICNTCCPVFAQCRAWVESLPPSQRPSGVIAGQLADDRTAA